MESKIVLVTGSSSGFGRLITETLARQGHTVFAGIRDTGGRNADQIAALQALADRDGLKIHSVDLDVTDESSVTQAVSDLLAQAGRLEVLVNNVGQGSWGLTEGFTAQQTQQLFETNVFGAMRLNRAVLPQMRSQRSGLLIHVSTLVGRLVLPFMVPYAAAKHALETVAEGYRYELAPFGVDSVIVEPQSYPTAGSLDKMVLPHDQERVQAYGDLAVRGAGMFAYNDQSLRSGQMGNPQDVADAVATLMAMPTGARPLRTVVAAQMGGLVEPINAVTEGVQAQLLQFTGLGDLAASTPAVPAS